jgi:hypothetical protein
MLPPKLKAPDVALQVCAVPKVMALLIVSVLALLFVMPPPWMVRTKPPVELSVKAPAPLLKVSELMLQFASMSGASRVFPPKVRLAVPLFAGTPLGFQLFAVDHKLFPPPPSQVVPALAGTSVAKKIRAHKNRVTPKGNNAKLLVPVGLQRSIVRSANSGFRASTYVFPLPPTQ